MRPVLSSQERPLSWPLDLSEMSVPLSLNNIDVSPTMSMTACIFTLICISIIFYEIFKYTDGALHQPDVASTGYGPRTTRRCYTFIKLRSLPHRLRLARAA